MSKDWPHTFFNFCWTTAFDAGSSGAKASSSSKTLGHVSLRNTFLMNSSFTRCPPDKPPYQSSFSSCSSSSVNPWAEVELRWKRSSAVSCTNLFSRASGASPDSWVPADSNIQSIGRTKSGQYSCWVITSTSSDGKMILPAVASFTPAGRDMACRPQPAMRAKAVLLPAPFGPVIAYTRGEGSTRCGTFTRRADPRENSTPSNCKDPPDSSVWHRMRSRALASDRLLVSSRSRAM
mmetsp:Transcript_116498/g.340850  ORF Transcript_116498/g.340850 Transcript_116498/m.340850 type:complete len:235 (-) Transcript_116498:1423-2127(-)